ncbi:protein TIC 22-like, chloroplastic [Andrographis paniculata]|uniref:protein TIC 22-like, chloroplastic n=1 Tax=Andrographis paniculata TaxID=175694 RepID=UPI0021E8FE2F|nr:protein TIC 22-like, chloroplastic [Andrographis paniculata]
MNFFKPRESTANGAASSPPPPPPPPHVLLQHAINSVQTHFSNLVNEWRNKPLLRNPVFAKISNGNNTVYGQSNSVGSSSSAKNFAMSDEAIEERLAGVPVYALSNGSQEFVLVSGTNTGKNLGLFCFSEADADSILKQMKSVDPSMSSGSEVVAVALSKIFQLKVDGVAFRLIPEASQIRNALKERKTSGVTDESFPGVPVFQSKSLILRSHNKRYRPAFFRKEDLDKSLSRASRDQRQLNPLLRQGEIQVATLEDIIQQMKDTSVSSCDDVVFIPPGFDVSTDPFKK